MIKQELKRQKDKMQADLETKDQNLQRKTRRFSRKKKSVLDEKARTKQAQELGSLQQEAEKLLMESQAQMTRLQEQLIPPMNEKILDVAKQIGRKDGFDYILDKSAVLFSSDKDDLTTKVIADLDKVTPSTLPASGGKN